MTTVAEPIESGLARAIQANQRAIRASHFKERYTLEVEKRVGLRNKTSDQRNRINALHDRFFDDSALNLCDPNIQEDPVYGFLLKSFDSVMEDLRKGLKPEGCGLYDVWPSRAMKRMVNRVMGEDEYLALLYGDVRNSVHNYLSWR